MGVINKIRAPIDKALDWLIDWIVTHGEEARQVRRPGRRARRIPGKRVDLALGAAVTAAKVLGNRVTKALLQPTLNGIKTRYSLTSISAFEKGGEWWAEASASPKKQRRLTTKPATKATAPPTATTTPFNPAKPSNAPEKPGVDEKCKIKIERPEFRKSLKKRFLAEYPAWHEGHVLADEIDRRHVVSNDDMAKHYITVLGARLWSEAKALLAGKGEKLAAAQCKNEHIQAAAAKRHKNFFNDIDNLWPGDASENRSIGAKRDPPKHWTKAQAEAHTKEMYRRWGLN